MTAEITSATPATAFPNPAAVTNPVAWIIEFGPVAGITPVSLVSETRTQVRVASKSGCDYTFRKNRVAPKSVEYKDPRILDVNPAYSVQCAIMANSLYSATSSYRGHYLCFHAHLVDQLQKRLQEGRKAATLRVAIGELEDAKTTLLKALGEKHLMVTDLADKITALRAMEQGLRG